MALSPVYVNSPGLRKSSAKTYTAAAAALLGGNPSLGSVLSPTVTTPTAPATTPTTGAVDYGKLLSTDPILGQSNANIAAAGIQNQAQLTAARRAALASYGAIPGNFGFGAGDVGSDIDQTTRQLADQATAGGVSTVARLQKAYQQQQQGDVASLAARGLLRSGATGQHLSEDLSNYNVAGYDAQQKLLDYLNGLWQGFQQQQQALQAQGLSAQNDALLALIEKIKAGLITTDPNAPGASPAAAPAPPATAPSAGNVSSDVGYQQVPRNAPRFLAA